MPNPNDKILALFEAGGKIDEQLQGVYTKRLIDAYQESLKVIREMIGKTYLKFGSDVTFAEMTQFNRLTNLEREIVAELKKLGVNTVHTIRGSIIDQYTQAFQYTIFATEQTLQVRAGFGGISTKQVEAAVRNPLNLIRWDKIPESIGKTTTELNARIRAAITEGLMQGRGFQATTRAVREAMEADVNNNIFRIIRTETHRAQSAGRLAGFETSTKIADNHGFEAIPTWLSTLDQRTRPQKRPGRRHVPNHRLADKLKAKKVDGVWLFTLSDGTVTRGPGLCGVAGHDINCRCSTYLQFTGIPAQFRLDNIDKEPIGDTNYVDWAKSKDLKVNPDIAN